MGYTNLSDEKIQHFDTDEENDPNILYPGVPEWKGDERHLQISVTGSDGKNKYIYEIEFSEEEIAVMVEAALMGASRDPHVIAHAKGMGAYIREILGKHGMQKS